MVERGALVNLAASVLAVASALEVGEVATGELPFPALPRALSGALAIGASAAWAAGSIALVRRARTPRRREAPVAGRLAWIALVCFGLAETLLGTSDGSAHLVAGMIVAIAIEIALAPEERSRGTRDAIDVILGRDR